MIETEKYQLSAKYQQRWCISELDSYWQTAQFAFSVICSAI